MLIFTVSVSFAAYKNKSNISDVCVKDLIGSLSGMPWKKEDCTYLKETFSLAIFAWMILDWTLFDLISPVFLISIVKYGLT